MTVWRSVPFDIPEAQSFADISSVRFDLTSVWAICQRWLSEYEKTAPDWEVIQLCCTAAIVRYGRTIAPGMRLGVPVDVIEALPEDLRQAHTYFKDLRDKWVAHSVNAFEETHVMVTLQPEERGRAVTDVRTQQTGVVALAAEDAQLLQRLAMAVHNALGELEEREKQVILGLARQVPLEDLYAREMKAIRLDVSKPGKPRRRFRGPP